MSNVDIDYFRQIVKSINLNAVKWFISHHGNDELNSHRDTIHKLGVRMKLVHFSDLKDIGGREAK